MQLARLRPNVARFLTGASLFAVAIPALSQTVLMSVHPVFDGLQPGSGVTPVEVDLANAGPDATGTVRVSVGDYNMSYPVELPQGTKKKLITYPDCGSFAQGALQFDLITNKGRLHESLEPNGVSGPGQAVVGEITQNGGDLGFLKARGQDYTGITPQDAYAKPEDAPTRPAGYERLNALVMGDGAERLSDDSVSAIKTWTLGGGTIIFVGGASAPILNDARWATVMPVQNATQKNLGGSIPLENRYGSSPAPFTAMVGDPVKGASARAGGLIIERPFGLGRAVYIAFNPFENPMLAWNSRPKMFAELLSPGMVTGPQMVINSVINTQALNPYSRGYYSYPGGPPQPEAAANNPFRATLPDTSTVLWILAGYFLAVVPINFFVLRRLKKGELAWGTAPLLSLAFAGVFFAAAQGLYMAQLSTSTKGLLITQQGDPNALIFGYSQMFFPHGGNYDMKLTGVDSLMQTGDDNPYPHTQHSIYEDIDPTDRGAVQASISVPNLAFREMTYRQDTQVNGWFDVHRLADGSFQVTNNSDYPLINARLVGGGGWVTIGDLQAKQSWQGRFVNPTFTADDLPSRLGQYLVRSSALALTGRVKGLRAGPQIGDEVKDSAGLTLAFISNEKLKNDEMNHSYQGMGDALP